MNAIKQFVKRTLNFIRILLRHPFSNQIGKGTEVCKQAYLTHCKIGNYCYLGMYSYFNHVEMGNYCSISGFVTIGAMEHDYTDISTSTYLGDGGYSNRITHIGNDVWIGAQCVIRQGVTIGDGAVVGANSFVNKDIPPYAIVFGTPAKIYKYRFDKELIDNIHNSGLLLLSQKDALSVIDKIKHNNK